MKRILMTFVVVFAGFIGVFGQPSKPKPKIDYKLFTFELLDCQLFGTRITCELMVTNNDRDRELKVQGSYYDRFYSRMIDTVGKEHKVSKVHLGSSESTTAANALLVNGVPFKLTVYFDDIPQNTTSMSLLDIAVEYDGMDYNNPQRSVQFRNVPLTIATPRDDGPQRVFKNEFSFDLISCLRLGNLLKCSISMKNNGSAEKRIGVEVGDKRHSRMIDGNGLERMPIEGGIANDIIQPGAFKSIFSYGVLPQGGSTRVELTFNDAAAIPSVKLLRFSVGYRSSYGGLTDTFNVDFRDVPVRLNAQDGNVNSVPTPAATPKAMATPPPKNKGNSMVDGVNSLSLGNPVGIDYIETPQGKGAVFSRKNQSRIQFPTQIPDEGTLEWRIKVDSGYEYQDFKLTENKRNALIFTTAGPDVWYPGSTWLHVHSDGTLTLDMATSKYEGPKQTLVAKNTNFRFGQWHTLGISYGASGQHISLDGVVVASAPRNTQKLGRGGTHDAAVGIPTIGEFASGFWANNRYESGFEGVIDSFRVSKQQKDWNFPEASLTPATPVAEAIATAPKALSTKLGSPGYYFTINTCNACCYDWHDTAANNFSLNGMPATVVTGQERVASDTKPFAPIPKFEKFYFKEVARDSEICAQVTLYVGPFPTENSALKAVDKFSPLLFSIFKNRGTEDMYSPEQLRVLEKASVIQDGTSNNWRFGNDDFFTISGYQLIESQATLKSEATKSWPLFWAKFSKAVSQKDFKTLVTLSASDEDFFDGGGGGTSLDWFKMMSGEWPSVKKAVIAGVTPIRIYDWYGETRVERTTRKQEMIFLYAGQRWFFFGVMGD